MPRFRRRLPFGAELEEGAARFRLWAPTASDVALCLEGREPLPMERDAAGFCEVRVEGVGDGARYGFLVDGELEVPDPASRQQPDGVHGRSAVVDSHRYRWRHDWGGRPWHEAIVYELHLGTFTPEGSYRAAIERLDDLVSLGVTAIELMPVAEAPGDRSWGYDGAQLFAPSSAYGEPDDLKRLVDEAHGRGLVVLLDVVYNHFGPEGNYLHRYAGDMFTDEVSTPWGTAIDVDGPARETVRELFVENALYWLEEYRFDGLRLDAVHALPQSGRPTFVEELADAVRARIDDRHVHLVVENDDNRASLLEGRYDAQWNDDFHHAMHVLLTGERDGYYRDHQRTPLADLGRCLAEGFAYQGETSVHRGGRPRGQPSAHLRPTAFVTFLQNHDQVGNRAFGERLHALTSAEAFEAAFTVALLAPSIPLLFMGEEWAASTPFLFFCDFEPGLQEKVRRGRRSELASFEAFRDPAARRKIPDPGLVETMERARLCWEERERPEHRAILERYRALLVLRREAIVPRLGEAGPGRYGVDGSHLSVRWPLGDATLGLELNVGKEPVSFGDRSDRRVLATTANVAGGSLPRWGVSWWLGEAR